MLDSGVTYATLEQVAEDIRTGKRSARETAQGVLDRIAAINPSVNAVVTLDEADVRAQADVLDAMQLDGRIRGPLHGVPITVKDNLEVNGVRATASHLAFKDNIAHKDAVVVARLREAGAIFVGKTNLPDMAMDFQTNSPIFGRANNPWDLERTTGGSTGGGAAAVASGISCLEVGNDLLGSIRIPAHFCGVCGFVPSTFAIPRTGVIPETPTGGSLSQLLRIGVLARDVGDIIRVFPLLVGPDGEDACALPIAWEYGQTIAVAASAENEMPKEPTPDDKALKIAWVEDAEGIGISRETSKLLGAFLTRVAEKGHRTERLDSGLLGFRSAKHIFAGLLYPVIGTRMPKPVLLAARILGKNPGFHDNFKRYLANEADRHTLIRKVDKVFLDHDILICPVSSTPAYPHLLPEKGMGGMPRYTRGIEVDGVPMEYGDANTAFTILFSVTGHPVVVIPIGKTENGLPVGIQIVGKRWSDPSLLNTAKRLIAFSDPIGHP